MSAAIDIALSGSNANREALSPATASSAEGDAFARLLDQLEQEPLEQEQLDPLAAPTAALIAPLQPKLAQASAQMPDQAPDQAPTQAPTGSVPSQGVEPHSLPQDARPPFASPAAAVGAAATLDLRAVAQPLERLVPSDPAQVPRPAPVPLEPVARTATESRELPIQPAPGADARSPLLPTVPALAVAGAAPALVQAAQRETSAVRRAAPAPRTAATRPVGAATIEPLLAEASPDLGKAAAAPAGAPAADVALRAAREGGEAARAMLHPERAAVDDPRARPSSERPVTAPGTEHIERAALQPGVPHGPVDALAAAPAVDPSRPVASTLVEPGTAGRAEHVVPTRVEWLASRGGGSARVVLHPAELGEIEISVRVRGNAVDVVIQTQEPAAQMALANLRDQLGESLVARELRIGSLEIRTAEARGELADSGSSSTQDRESGHANAGSRDSFESFEDASHERSNAQAAMRAEAGTAADEQSPHPADPTPHARIDLHV